jgi:hypothetical protein
MTVWFQQTIALQSHRLDLIKSAQDAAGIDPNMRGYIDVAWDSGDSLVISGWAFECGATDLLAVDVRLNAYMIDGTPYLTHGYRPDVLADAGLNGWCPAGIPGLAGVALDVPIGHLLPGLYYVRLRLWNADGHNYETNSYPVSVS